MNVTRDAMTTMTVGESFSTILLGANRLAAFIRHTTLLVTLTFLLTGCGETESSQASNGGTTSDTAPETETNNPEELPGETDDTWAEETEANESDTPAEDNETSNEADAGEETKDDAGEQEEEADVAEEEADVAEEEEADVAEEEEADVAEEEEADVAEEEADVAEEEQADVAEEEQADVAEEEQADVAEEEQVDVGEEEDAGADSEPDSSSNVPDWVDPEVPEGPIPGPKGTDSTPEEEDFTWVGIGTQMIGNSFPLQSLEWYEHPKYGTATILDWSENEKCVCFDLDCSTCSEEACGPTACTYDYNDSHTLTKYHVELRANDYPTHFVTFEVNISAAPAIVYTNIQDVLDRLERIPVEYWYGFRIITEFGNGIQFFHGSYFGGGAAAYGSMNYIDTQTVDMGVLLHELGHTFEQYTRIGNSPILEPQSNILNPIWRNAIRSDNNRTSWYGNSNEWEDMAEFSRIHAQCLVEGSLDSLESLSPERFRIWELILLNGTTIKP